MDNTAGQWYVLHTLSGQENRVRENVEKQIKMEDASLPVYEVLIPTEQITEVKNGKKTTVKRKFFPGYVLVRMELYDADGKLDENTWHFIHGIQGVISFSGGGEKPMPMSQEEIDIWINHPAEQPRPPAAVPGEVGETVRIKDGPFENFSGVIVEIDPERGKLKLMVSIFGRSTPVEVEFWQVEREE